MFFLYVEKVCDIFWRSLKTNFLWFASTLPWVILLTYIYVFNSPHIFQIFIFLILHFQFFWSLSLLFSKFLDCEINFLNNSKLFSPSQINPRAVYCKLISSSSSAVRSNRFNFIIFGEFLSKGAIRSEEGQSLNALYFSSFCTLPTATNSI